MYRRSEGTEVERSAVQIAVRGRMDSAVAVPRCCSESILAWVSALAADMSLLRV